MNTENICKFNPNRSSDLVCADFVLERSDCAAKPKRATKFILHLAAGGEAECFCEGERARVAEGSLFFVGCGETYSIAGNADFEYLYITFEGRRAKEVAERIGVRRGNRVFDGFGELIPFWQDSLARTDSRNIDLMSEAVLLYTLARLEPLEHTDHRLTAAVTRLTADCFTDPDLTLAAAAAQPGYDAKYPSFVFRRETGVTYTQYLRDLRVKRAEFLMEQGVTSIQNVARLSGFRDPLYFSKVFAKAEGMSPRAYLSALEAQKGSV